MTLDAYLADPNSRFATVAMTDTNGLLRGQMVSVKSLAGSVASSATAGGAASCSANDRASPLDTDTHARTNAQIAMPRPADFMVQLR